MSVKKRVDAVFKTSIWSGYYENRYARMSKEPQYRFRPRVKELLALEGKYDNPSYPNLPIHISCRFNDILRCSDTPHFISCYRATGEHKRQPFLRCVNRDWAIAFIVDKHGSFMARCWIQYNAPTKSEYYATTESINLFRIYGNKLESDDVRALLNNLFIKQHGRQVWINGGISDDYIEFE